MLHGVVRFCVALALPLCWTAAAYGDEKKSPQAAEPAPAQPTAPAVPSAPPAPPVAPAAPPPSSAPTPEARPPDKAKPVEKKGGVDQSEHAARGVAASLRLDALGYNGAYNTGAVFFPQAKIGAVGEWLAGRFIIGYTRSSISQTSNYYNGSSSSDTSASLVTVGGEISGYFTGVREHTLATYASARLAKAFYSSGSGSSSRSTSSDDMNSPLLFGLGLGAEWCFSDYFSIGVETGFELGYAWSDSGNSHTSALSVGLPYGLLTVNAYLF